MTQPSSRSWSTSSPQPSPDGAPGVLSRRGLFRVSAAWAALLTVGDVAWAANSAAAAPAPAQADSPSANTPSHLTYQDSLIQVTIDARAVQDVTVLHCEFTDVTTAPETYELSSIDNKTGKESRPRTLDLVPGVTRAVNLYGGINRSFTIKLCPQSATTCLMLGPVAAQGPMAAKAIGIRMIR